MRRRSVFILVMMLAVGLRGGIAQEVVLEDEFLNTDALAMPGIVQSGAGASLVNDATAPEHGPECLHVDGSMTVYFKDIDLVDGEILVLWRDTDVDVGGSDADGTLYFRVHDTSLLGLTTGASGAGQTDYWIEQDHDAGFQLKKCDGLGSEVTLANMDDVHKIDGKGWVWHKARFIGNRILAKYWQAGQPEPPTWLIDVTDPTATRGAIGLGCWSGQANFAYIRITNLTMRATAPLATMPVTLDGVMSPGEWDDANSYYFDGSDLENRPGWNDSGAPITPSDWSCVFYVKHDADNVYVATVVTDDTIMDPPDSGGNVWEDDTMELYFDTDNSDTPDIRDISQPGRGGDARGFQISYRSDNTAGTWSLGGPGEAVQWWWAQASITPPGFVVEFRVAKALDGVTTPMQTGHTYGFDLSPDDDDDGSGRDAQIVWNAQSGDVYFNESLWGEIFLSPEALATTPVAPTNLVAKAGDGSVKLDWDPVPGTVDGYRIYQSETSGGPYTEVSTTTLVSHTVSGLTNNTTYYFVVTAFNAVGEGPKSNEASATPQAGISLRSRNWQSYR